MKRSRKDYYKFIAKNAIRGLIWFAAIIGLYLIFDYTVGDRFEAWAKPLENRPLLILAIFFASETLFGIIPLEFFVLWAGKFTFETFLFLLFVLSVLSYVGGIIAYYFGRKIKHIPFLEKLFERESFQQYKKLYRRYGGILIVLAALTPLPFATFSMISASMGFPFNRYLLYSASRFLRFLGVGVFVWMSGI
jgi:membrane protein YqaA with SNARE-associated domain